MADSVKIKITGDDSAFRKTLSVLGSVTKAVVKGIGVAGTATKAAWDAVGEVGVKYNAEIEQLKTSFEVMTGSAEKAASVTDRLKQIASSTPFGMQELASTTQLLMNYGFTADRAVDEMMMLGDIAQGNSEAMNSIALGYAQMSSAGKVSLEDIKQMIDAGFNPLQEISQRTGESMESLYGRISGGKMVVSEITESMRAATSEGGMYYQSMEKQAETFQGRLDTLKEDATAFAGQLMESASGGLRDTLLPMATDLVSELSGAFESGGFDRLVTVVAEKIPQLFDTVVAGIKQFAPKVTQFLKTAVSQIAGTLPNLLRGISDIAPQIVASLFEVANQLVQDLVTMLPELVPTIIAGVAKLIPGILKGVANLGKGIFEGIKSWFKKEDPFDDFLEGADKDVLAKLRATAKIDFNTEITTDDYVTEINGTLDKIREALGGLNEQDRLEVMMAIVNGTGGSDLLEKALKAAYPDVDVTPITNAMDTISTTVAGLGLSEDASKHLTELINGGADADEISKALQSYGVDPGTADATALTITTEMDTIVTTAEALGLPPGLTQQLSLSAGNDQAALVAALQLLGVSEDDIATVLAGYEDVSGSLTAKAEVSFSDLAAKLTDGLKENDEGAANGIKQYFKDAYGKIDGWKADALQELKDQGLTGDAYDAEAEKIISQYDTMVSELNRLEQEANSWHETNAGAATETVRNNLSALEEILGRVQELNAQIDILTNEAFDAVRARRTLLQNGAVLTTDEQKEVFAYTTSEYEANVAAINAKTQAALDQAAITFKNSRTDFNNAREDIIEQGETELLAAEATYNDERLKNIQGMVLANPIAKASMEDYFRIEDLGKQAEDLKGKIASAISRANMTGEEIDPEAFFSGLKASGIDYAAIAEQLGFSPTEFMMKIYDELMSGGETSEASGKLTNWLDEQLQKDMDAALSAAEDSMSVETAVLKDAVEKGYLDPAFAGIDVTNTRSLLAGVMGDIMGGGAEAIGDGSDEMTTAATNAANSAATAMDASGEAAASGTNTVDGYVLSVYKGVVRAYNAGVALGNAVRRGTQSVLQIQSPSKVMARLGMFTGEGFTEGLTESMGVAVKSMPRLMHNLIGAANLPFKLSLPDVTQSIAAALVGGEAAVQPLGFYVNGKKLAEVQAENNRRAANARIRHLALGVGK